LKPDDAQVSSTGSRGIGPPFFPEELVLVEATAFVDDHVAGFGDAVIDDALPDETLNNCDVEQPSRSASPRRVLRVRNCVTRRERGTQKSVTN